MKPHPAIRGRRSNRRVLDYSLLILAAGIGILASFTLRQLWAKQPGGGWVWLLLLAGGAIGAFALVRMDAWLPDPYPDLRSARHANPPHTKQGLYCWIGAVLLTAWLVARLWPDYHQWQGTFIPWILAISLVIAGAWRVARLDPPGRDEHLSSQALPAGWMFADWKLPAWSEVLAFVMILGIAVFLRVVRLGDIPAGIYVDETNGALDALYILEGNQASPFGTGWYGTPNGFIYYMAGLFRLFGVHFGTLKAVSLIPAILAVPAIFLLGRMMFGTLGGLCAMAFLAFSRWHLSMSRWGWNELAPLPFQILATFFLLRGLRSRKTLDFALGGLLTGLMLYTYPSSRLAIATLGLFIMYWLLTDREGPWVALGRHWRGLALFILAALIAAAPLLVTHVTDPFTWSNRVREISIFRDTQAAGSLQPLLDNLRDHLRFFHQVGDHQGKHNLPGEPQTDLLLGTLFVIGLAYGLWRWRDRRRGLLWLWLLLGMAGGIFSSNHGSPQAYRTLSALPALALLGGDVLSRLSRAPAYIFRKTRVPVNWGSKRANWRSWPGTGFGVVLLMLFLGGNFTWEAGTYFGRQANSIAVQAGFNLTENQVAHETLQALSQGINVFLSPRFYDFSPLRFRTYAYYKQTHGTNTLDQRPYQLARPEQDVPVPDTGQDALFLLDTQYASVLQLFQYYYPNMQVDLVQWKEAIPLYVRLRIPRSDLAAAQGVLATLIRPDGTQVDQILPKIDHLWKKGEASSAEWSASLQIDASGVYDFTSQGDLQVSLDGNPWQGERFLCTGMHSLQVGQDLSQSQGVAQLKMVDPDGFEAVIPSQAYYRISPPAYGLSGAYYGNTAWEGEPLCTQLTPLFLLAWPGKGPVNGAFSARFTGMINIPQSGLYGFRLFADDGVRFTLDGTVLGEELTPNRPNTVTTHVDLIAGFHPIQIDYFQQGGGSALEFYWTPPGGMETPVPPVVLSVD